jgi:hypothetical protein
MGYVRYWQASLIIVDSKKMMAFTITLEINLVHQWSPLQCTQCKQVLIWVSHIFYERGGTNRPAWLLWPLVATRPDDITESPSLLCP